MGVVKKVLVLLVHKVPNAVTREHRLTCESVHMCKAEFVCPDAWLFVW